MRNSFLILVGMVLALACAPASATKPSNAATQPALVWPPAPDEPRIRYVGNLHGPADIGQSASVFSRFSHWVTGKAAENVTLQKPFGLGVDEHGNLCITDTEAKRVYYCDLVQKKWQAIERAGKIRFAMPVAIARRDGVFYLADSGLAKVLAFRDEKTLLWELSSPLQRPVGVALAGNLVAVADAVTHAVYVFDLRGRLQFQFGRRGTGTGEFNFPTHVAADGQGHWLVTDSMNCRIQLFDLAGRFVSEFGSNGNTSGYFSRPKGVAADTYGHIYVADALFDNFQVFDLQGRLLLNVGQNGARPGEFGLPAGIAITQDNRIYVADSYNRRVQVFQFVGQP